VRRCPQTMGFTQLMMLLFIDLQYIKLKFLSVLMFLKQVSYLLLKKEYLNAILKFSVYVSFINF